MLPKQAHYHLRYTSISFYIKFLLYSCLLSLLCSPSCGARNLFGSYRALTFRPLRQKTLALSATGSAHVFRPKQARYHLRYTSISFYIKFLLYSCLLSLLCSPSCGARNLFGSYRALTFRPLRQKTLALSATGSAHVFRPKQARYHLRYTSISFYIKFLLYSCLLSLLCSPSCGARNLFGSYRALTFRPLRQKTLALSVTGSARVFCPKQARYHLRYTSIISDAFSA